MTETILAIDFGHKRIGMAICETDSKVPSALPFMSRTPNSAKQLADFIDKNSVSALVIGLPYNMDGSEGRAAARVREFAEQMRKWTEVPIHWVDERLTSFEADNQMKSSGIKPSKRKLKRDSIAACILLQTFLESKAD